MRGMCLASEGGIINIADFFLLRNYILTKVYLIMGG